VREADSHAPLDAGSPERLVDHGLLRTVSTAGGLVDELRRGQELFERDGPVDGGMIGPHHADIVFLEQNLAADRSLEFLEVADGQVDVAGLQRHRAHARGRDLHGVHVHRGRFAGNELDELRQQHHLPEIAHEDAERAIGLACIEFEMGLDRLAHVAQRLAQRAGDRFCPRCGRHAVTGAHEERVLQHFAQTIQVLADCWLREMQVRSGNRDAARLIDRVEHPQQVQIQAIEAHDSMPPGPEHDPRRRLFPVRSRLLRAGGILRPCISGISTFHST